MVSPDFILFYVAPGFPQKQAVIMVCDVIQKQRFIFINNCMIWSE